MKKNLLIFITGTDRAPIGGLSKLTMTIGRMGGDSDKLPTANTCANILHLPEYNSKNKLKAKLELALKYK